VLTNLENRKKNLQRSLTTSKTKQEYTVDIVDYIECENKYYAKEIESVFEGYFRLRANIESKRKKDNIDGKTEFYKSGILKKWNFYVKNKSFIALGLTPKAVVRYSRNVLQKRWEEAEYIIVNSNYYSCIMDYSIHVIKGKWPEGERNLLGIGYDFWHRETHDGKGNIRKDSRRFKFIQYDIYDYCDKIYFFNERWIEFENTIESWINQGKYPNLDYLLGYDEKYHFNSEIIRNHINKNCAI
jgi:hypothetical protein